MFIGNAPLYNTDTNTAGDAAAGGSAATAEGKAPFQSGGDVGGGGKIELTRKEYDDLVAARSTADTYKKEVETYKKRWDNVDGIVKGKDPADIDRRTRQLYADAGYTMQQIDEMMKGTIEAETQAPQGKKGRAAEEDDEGPSELDQKLDTLSQNVESLTKAQQEDWYRRHTQMLNEQTGQALDSSRELRTMLDTLVKFRLPESSDQQAVQEYQTPIRQEVREEVLRAVKAALREEQSRSGQQWNPNWMVTLVPKAAQDAVKKAVESRSRYLPDPSKLGIGSAPNPYLDAQGRPPKLDIKGSDDVETRKDKLSKWASAKLLADPVDG